MSRRILHVTNGLLHGGAEHMIALLAEEQRRRGDDVTVLALRRGGPVAEAMIRDGLRVLTPRAWLEPREILRSMDAIGRPDLVHSHLFVSDVCGFAVARAAGAASVTTLHNVWSAFRFSKTESAIARRLYPRFDAAVAVALPVEETFRVEVPRLSGLSVIDNPTREVTDQHREAGLRLRAGLAAKHLVVAIGRLVEDKGFATLIDAVADLRDVELWIAGEGPLRASLAARRGRVRLLGPRDDALALLCAADVVAIPSFMEGLPLVALEACAAGAVVVHSGAGGLSRLFDGGPFPAVPPGDVPAWRAAIRRALDVEPLRRQARQLGLARARAHAPALVASRYDEVYALALARRAGRRFG